jgi:uncharacterized membrane protein YiaA
MPLPTREEGASGTETDNVRKGMRDVGLHGRWRDLVGLSALTLVALLVVGAAHGGPLLSSAALVGFPVAVTLCAIGFALLRRRYRDEHPTGDDSP